MKAIVSRIDRSDTSSFIANELSKALDISEKE